MFDFGGVCIVMDMQTVIMKQKKKAVLVADRLLLQVMCESPQVFRLCFADVEPINHFVKRLPVAFSKNLHRFGACNLQVLPGFSGQIKCLGIAISLPGSWHGCSKIQQFD